MTAITTNPGVATGKIDGIPLLAALSTQSKGTINGFTPTYPYTRPTTGQLWPKPF